MRLLDLFTGTGSIANHARELGYEVTTLDLSGADINIDVLEWDYTQYPVGHFDVIWASPPCTYFSNARCANIGRHGITKETMEQDLITKGLPILYKTEKIIDYFRPSKYWIENPSTGRMKEFINRPYYILDYCMYGFPCRKRTQLWTNVSGLNARLCDKRCGSFFNNKHLQNTCGGNKTQKGRGGGNSKTNRYEIPEQLVKQLLSI
jgi:hypothetical protein